MQLSHLTIVLSGRGDRVQGVEGDVVTTEVCPRSRPEGRRLDPSLSSGDQKIRRLGDQEGRRLDPSLSLPPPPLQEKPR